MEWGAHNAGFLWGGTPVAERSRWEVIPTIATYPRNF